MPDESFPQLDLDAQLCFPLYAATRALTRRYTGLLAEVGLTYPQYLCLLALWQEDGPLSVSELGTRLHLDSGTLTPLVKRLEGAGHVTRRRDPGDERRVLVEVSAQGRALRARVADVPHRLVAGLGMTPEQGRELRELLGVLLDELDQLERGSGATPGAPAS